MFSSCVRVTVFKVPQVAGLSCSIFQRPLKPSAPADVALNCHKKMKPHLWFKKKKRTEPSLNIKCCKLILEGTKRGPGSVRGPLDYYQDCSVTSWTPGPSLTISSGLMTLLERRSPSPQTSWNALALDLLWSTSDKCTRQIEAISGTLGTSRSDFHAGLVKQWHRQGACITMFILITEKFSFIIHWY